MEPSSTIDQQPVPNGNHRTGFVIGAIVLLIAGGVVGYVLGSGGSEPVVTGTPTASVSGSAQVEGIVIQEPSRDAEIALPIVVKGFISGNGWSANEGEAGSVALLDGNSKQIGTSAVLKATTPWRNLPVSFEATVGDRELMSYLTTPNGYLKFTSYASKDGEGQQEYVLPIRFASNIPVQNNGSFKTYSTSLYNFQFQYSDSLVLEKASNLQGAIVALATPQKLARWAAECANGCMGSPYTLQVTAIPNTTLDQFTKAQGTSSTRTQITFAGRKAYEELQGAESIYVITTENRGTVYKLIFEQISSKPYQGSVEMQIISSFKFSN